MRRRHRPRQARKKVPIPAKLAAVAAAVLGAVSFLTTAAAPAGASTASAASTASTAGAASTASTAASHSSATSNWVTPTTPSDVPYALPVHLPSTTSSPAVASNAPYTPAVLNLIAQLERIVAGETVIDPTVVRRLLQRQRTTSTIGTLNPRERDVLSRMAEGRSNVGIAKDLFLSPRTVEAHVTSVFAKLGLEATDTDNNRVRAVLTYLRSGDDPS